MSGDKADPASPPADESAATKSATPVAQASSPTAPVPPADLLAGLEVQTRAVPTFDPASATDPFTPQPTDAALLAPFEHTVAEGAVFEQSEALLTVATGEPTLDPPTMADPGAPLETALTNLERPPEQKPALTTFEPDVSPVPELSLEGAFVAPPGTRETLLAGAVEAEVPSETSTRSIAGAEVSSLGQRSPRRGGRKPSVEKSVAFNLGGYQAHRRLGEGGMAEVFLARSPGAEEDVVLKRVQAHLTDDERILKMFRREARIASRLDHPNIVKIIDFAEEEGSLFLVMEYLDGSDFRDLAYRWWATSRPLPIEPIVELCAQAALGLDYAHALPTVTGEPGGLVHRDISPENLFLTKAGVIKLLDFGIARTHEHESDGVTMTGEVKGKVPYMSPEQIIGTPLDGRSDLWSLTVVLYWLLTGHRPFDGPNDFMTIKQVMEVDPVPPADVNDLVPRALDDVVRKGLAKDREQRYARGQDMHDALMALITPLGDKKVDRHQLGSEVDRLPKPEIEPEPYHPAAVPFARWSS